VPDHAWGVAPCGPSKAEGAHVRQGSRGNKTLVVRRPLPVLDSPGCQRMRLRRHASAQRRSLPREQMTSAYRSRSCTAQLRRRRLAPLPRSLSWSLSSALADAAVHRRTCTLSELPCERPRPALTGGADSWKACWGQPLTSSNLVSSAPAQLGRRRARPHRGRALRRSGVAVTEIAQ
jgi:hypothetical protein